MRALAAACHLSVLILAAQGGTLAADAQQAPPPAHFAEDDGGRYDITDAAPAAPFRNQFLADHPDAKLYEVDRSSPGAASGGPALRLRRIWSAAAGLLMEVEGEPREGSANSAVMRRDTLTIVQSSGARKRLIEFSGGQELRDPKGGSAIVVRPGDVVYLLFEPVDDRRPYGLRHVLPAGGEHDYFGPLDPRFRERYDEAFAKATTPEGMKDFIVAFARNDPDGRVPQVFLTLVQKMREQNTFEGYYTAYLLMQEPNDLRMASRLARTTDHQIKMEHMGVATLTDKSRLLTLSVTPKTTSTQEREGGCMMFCRYNFSAVRPVLGTLRVGLNPRAPVKLRHGRYKVTFQANVLLPRWESRRSAWMGNREGRNDHQMSETITMELGPPHYTAQVDYNLGNAVVAFFQRGSAGGYEAHWATDAAQVSIAFKSMELMR